MGGGDRDIKMKEAAAMGGGDLNVKMEAVAIGAGDPDLKTKMKDEGGLEGIDTLKRNEGMFNLAGLLAMKSQKEVVAFAADVRDLKRNEASRRPWEEEGGILKLKKEKKLAFHLWLRTKAHFRKDPEAAQEKAQALGARKKKMKVVKSLFPKELIDHKAACPFAIFADLSDEKLAQYPQEFQKIYITAKLYEAKDREYWNALVAQQKEVGYAEDEIEATDDEEEVVN